MPQQVVVAAGQRDDFLAFVAERLGEAADRGVHVEQDRAPGIVADARFDPEERGHAAAAGDGLDAVERGARIETMSPAASLTSCAP